MKRWIQFLILVPTFVAAQVCPSANPMKVKFDEQKKWKDFVVKNDGVEGVVSGYVDKSNNFYIQEMESKSSSANLEIGTKNANHKTFLKDCNDFGNMAQYLRLERELKRNNEFGVSLRYLPELKQFSNDPFAAITTGSFTLEISYDSQSLIENLADAKYVKSEIYHQLETQLSKSSEIGGYKLNLVNLDDFVCDLIHGTAKISILRRMTALSPLTEMTEVIRTQDAVDLYSNWVNIQSVDSNEKMFLAGTIFESKKQSNQIADLPLERGVVLMRSLLDDSKMNFKKMSAQQLQCIVDDMQVYTQAPKKLHVITDFIFDKGEILNQGKL